MAKDYKHAARAAAKPKKKPLPVWLTFGVGLVCGLFVALLMYLQQRMDEQAPVQASGPVIEAPAPEKARKEKETKAAAEQAAGEARTGKDTKAGKDDKVAREDKEDTIAGIPKFDFYTILPNLEVILPEQEIQQKRESKNPADEARDDTSYLLQVGSFRMYSEADRLKARLALLGVEASIQKVSIANDETWFRVRVGPMASYRKIDNLRRRLNDDNISSIILKVKDGNT